MELYEVINSESNVIFARGDFVEDDFELMSADEEDKCYILGSIWGERLKMLPINSRAVVRCIIEQVFEEARTGKLANFDVIANNST